MELEGWIRTQHFTVFFANFLLFFVKKNIFFPKNAAARCYYNIYNKLLISLHTEWAFLGGSFFFRICGFFHNAACSGYGDFSSIFPLGFSIESEKRHKKVPIHVTMK